LDKILRFLLILCCCLPFSQLKALHIIGGEITYECLGNSEYRFSMSVYRDCYSINGAPFDDPANISVFRFNGTFPTLFTNTVATIQTQASVPPVLSSPCLEPPNDLCVEYAIYSWDMILPFDPAGYVVAYQRCCRNTTISNIIAPGTVGATYTATLTAESQSICNSSPTFNDFPPIVVCASEPLNFDHGATDPNGNTLVYSFCAPTIGASELAPAPTIATNPSAPFPHYPVVNYIGGFSPTNPMGGSPVIDINPVTGLITGTPTSIGQYVVGVCVEEFDATGNSLGIIRRDFQFNVTNCTRTVFADIAEDSLAGPQEYVVISCGEETVTFINESSQLSNIFGYYWEFDLGPGIPPVTSTQTNPAITFPGNGTYNGVLVVNPGSPQCTDTADIRVNIYPEITASFSYSATSCTLAPVTYTDLSVSGSGTITNWTWNFGDGNTSNDQNPVHQFSLAGAFNVSLTVRDINGCIATYTQQIEWFPESEILVNPEEDIGCEPFTVSIINNSFPINGYTTEWDLGDGNTSVAASPTHTYETPGTYTVSLTITSPIGCVSQQTFPDLITVYETPEADFLCDPQDPSNFDPVVTFTDQSTGVATWLWDFGTGDTSTDPSPIYSYPDTGKFVVVLEVTHIDGCTDTMSKIIDVVPRFTYFLPNAFTPNSDGVNEEFRGEGIFYGIEQFEMRIFNRWGEQVFQANDPNIAWNGLKNNTGKPVQNGVYIYLVNIIGSRNQKFEYKGFATVIR